MKHPVRTFLCIALVVGLVILAGSRLVVTDTEADAARVAVEVDGEAITKGEVDAFTDRLLRSLGAYDRYYGDGNIDISDPEIVALERGEAVQFLVRSRVVARKMAEYGVPPLTEEERAAAVAELLETAEGYGYDPARPDSARSVQALVDAQVECGLDDADTLIALAEDERLIAAVTRDMPPLGEEDLLAACEARAAEDSRRWPDAESAASAINNGELVTGVPDGLRLVRWIMITFTDEDQLLISDLDGEIFAREDDVDGCLAALEAAGFTFAFEGGEAVYERPADLPAELEETWALLTEANARLAELNAERERLLEDAFARIRAQADDVVDAALRGEDWDALTAAHNDDFRMMPGERTAFTGYALWDGCEDSGTLDPDVAAAALALERPGEVSEPARGENGWFVIRLERDLEEGMMPLDLIADDVRAQTEEAMRWEIYDNLVDEWLAAADVVVHEDVFR